jgi:hypothetical protein
MARLKLRFAFWLALSMPGLRSVQAQSPARQPRIDVLAGVPRVVDRTTDGVLASAATLADVSNVYLGSDGSIYFDEPTRNTVRAFKIGEQVRRVAGNGETPPIAAMFGRGGLQLSGPATQASLGRIDGGVIDPIANVLFLNAFNHGALVGVALDAGTVFVAAGGGGRGGGGRGGPDVGPASAVSLAGLGALCLAQSADARTGQAGVLFFLDSRGGKVRRLTYEVDPTTRSIGSAGVDLVASASMTSGRPLDSLLQVGLTSGCTYAAPLKKLLFSVNFSRVIMSLDFPSGPSGPPGDLAIIAGRPRQSPTSCDDGDGRSATAAAINPNWIAFDPERSTIFFSSGSLNCVRAFRIGGNIATVAGTGRAEDSGLGGPARSASFASPRGLAFDAGSGALYIAASGTRRILRLLNGRLDAVAGIGPSEALFRTPQPARSVSLGTLTAGAVGDDGTVYVVDAQHSVANRIDPKTGRISLFAGNGIAATDVSDNVPATSVSVGGSRGLAVDEHRNVYLVEGPLIRRIDDRGVIHLFAGTPLAGGFAGDGGPASSAQLRNPEALVYSPETGAWYFHEDGRIRRIDRNGIITTIAGTGSNAANSPDGTPALEADVGGASGAMFIWVDGRTTPETVYFTEGAAVRKFVVGGALATVAGGNGRGFNGDGIPATTATLTRPVGITGDRQGNLFLVDDARIRRIDRAGIITTLAGPDAPWKMPQGLQWDSRGYLIVFDVASNQVFRISGF